MFHIIENNSGLNESFFLSLLARAKEETRQEVADILTREFARGGHYTIYTGGHHVALINRENGKRLLLIGGTSPDFSDKKPQDAATNGTLGKTIPPRPRRFLHTFIGRDILADMRRRRHLCELISVSRERFFLEWTLSGIQTGPDDEHRWQAEVDERVGQNYDYILVGGHRRFAIERHTGKIFEVRGSGSVNRARSYGTLETVDDWNWDSARPTLRRVK